MVLLQEMAGEDIDFFAFYVKFRNLKDTYNKRYTLDSNPSVLVTNLFTKLPVIPSAGQPF
jgi:hypothetical protein